MNALRHSWLKMHQKVLQVCLCVFRGIFLAFYWKWGRKCSKIMKKWRQKLWNELIIVVVFPEAIFISAAAQAYVALRPKCFCLRFTAKFALPFGDIFWQPLRHMIVKIVPNISRQMNCTMPDYKAYWRIAIACWWTASTGRWCSTIIQIQCWSSALQIRGKTEKLKSILRSFCSFKKKCDEFLTFFAVTFQSERPKATSDRKSGNWTGMGISSILRSLCECDCSKYRHL